MIQPIAGRQDRVLGKSLLTLADVIRVATPLAADWNDSHISMSDGRACWRLSRDG
jgi:hypothetical protein